MTRLEQSKSELLSAVCSYADAKPRTAPDGVDLPGVLRAFYRHVAPEDLLERDPSDLYGALAAQLRLAHERPRGTAAVKVVTPTVSVNGWSAEGHTVVEVVTDDMPFLVDSVSMALTEAQHDLHLVIHPQFVVRRDDHGRLVEVLDEQSATDAADLSRESWMHLEIDRVGDTDLEEIHDVLVKVLTDVREAVEDWPQMHARVEEVVDALEAQPPPVPADELAQGAALLRWLAEDHFTFLGYREYALERDGEDEVLVPVVGSGLGILRPEPAGPRTLPAAVAEHAREPRLLVLAKANSKATVHRSVYLDYVGVKRFDEDGEVVGERRFLGLFSSTAYTESVRRIPVLREKAQAVMDSVGFDPQSHAGKALMDVLETYPRDELFQTPAEDLVPITSQVMHARERRQLKLFVRRDIYGRFLSCLVYLPRDRYNTSVRERISGILKQRLGGGEHRVRRARRRVLRGPAALRGPSAGRGRDRRARRGRPRAPVRRGRPLVARRLHRGGGRDVRRGAGQPAGPHVRLLLPRGLQGGLPPADRCRRPRPARADRGGGGPGALALRGRRGPRGRGAAEGLPDRLAALALRGAADPVHHGCRGGRRAALPARGPGP